MVLVPGPAPVTTPVLTPTVTADVLLLLQVPPVIPALTPNVVAEPVQTINDVEPVMIGTALSVTVCVAVQPAPGVV